jgi:glutathione synthase/RimK-type ligase-like ATP-grasp enzyme
MRVFLATCRRLPEPDPDQDLLLAALQERGLVARMAAWDDSAVSWAEADLVVLRSTWDYYSSPVEFLAWAEWASGVSRLLNPVEVVRWNHHKRYLLELERGGVRVVPTALLPRGARTSLLEIMGVRRWSDVVVKPAISASSFRTARFDRQSVALGNEHLASIVAVGDALVQEYLPSVERYGERALVWIDGEFTHAVRKHPRLMGGVEAVSQAQPIAPDERALGEMALAGWKPGELLYARVDMARDQEGRPRVMELELIEPSLFLLQDPAALTRMAEAISGRLR